MGMLKFNIICLMALLLVGTFASAYELDTSKLDSKTKADLTTAKIDKIIISEPTKILTRSSVDVSIIKDKKEIVLPKVHVSSIRFERRIIGWKVTKLTQEQIKQRHEEEVIRRLKIMTSKK
jgi:septum formation inhibitor-activating ATPase MinD